MSTYGIYINRSAQSYSALLLPWSVRHFRCSKFAILLHIHCHNFFLRYHSLVWSRRQLIWKMFLLAFFIFPAILAAPNELKIDGYGITIENNTLMDVQTSQRSSKDLNLSGLGIERIDKNAFKHVNNVTFLNLANNTLTAIPQSAFSILENLEHLSLVDNNIRNLNRGFVGLGKLKSLDISNNPVKFFQRGDLHGLNRCVDIITRGNLMKKINNALYDNLASPNSSEDHKDKIIKAKRDSDDDDDDDDEDDDDYDYNNDYADDCENGAPNPEDFFEYPEDQRSMRIKVCIVQGRVMLLDHMYDDEILPSTCRKVLHDNSGIVYLNNLGIETFEKGWYQVENRDESDIDIETIILTDNNITRITKEMLNDLPSSIKTVHLSRNKIKQLVWGTIRNYNILSLYINDNSIEDIQDGTFENMKLWQLIINGNRLKNVKFLESLPRSLTRLCVNRNQITELPNVPVWRLYNLREWYMRNNSITVVRTDALRGLSIMSQLDLTNNRIRTLEPGCFRGMENVHYLRLRGNEIANLEGDVFRGLIHLVELDLGRNKLTKISPAFRDSLPDRLEVMHLDYNLMKSLEAGAFVNVPKKVLNLQGNAISTIAKGSFIVPHLYGADLENRVPDFSEILGPLFTEYYLPTLLASNLSLPVPQKGIRVVNLSKNPVRRLENGALYGITKGPHCGVYLSETPIEFIQGGLFDDL